MQARGTRGAASGCRQSRARKPPLLPSPRIPCFSKQFIPLIMNPKRCCHAPMTQIEHNTESLEHFQKARGATPPPPIAAAAVTAAAASSAAAATSPPPPHDHDHDHHHHSSKFKSSEANQRQHSAQRQRSLRRWGAIILIPPLCFMDQRALRGCRLMLEASPPPTPAPKPTKSMGMGKTGAAKTSGHGQGSPCYRAPLRPRRRPQWVPSPPLTPP